MLGKSIRIASIASTAVVLLAASALSLETITVDINQVRLIVNPENQSDVRALLYFNLPNSLDSTYEIVSAELVFGVSIQSQFDIPINLLINPITTDWTSGQSSWTTPWTTPGGDYLSNKTQLGFIKQTGESEITIEVTRLIREFHSGSTPNYGLIIRQTGLEQRTFNAKRLGPQGNGPYGQMIIQVQDRF